MKKWILIGSGAIIIILIIVVFILLSNIGPIIKKAVNTYGPEFTKSEVSLRDVSVSILSAKAKLKDFYLGNPKGFKSPEAMKVGSILVDIDEKSITSDKIIIERIEVIKPEITYERTGSTDNFKTILNNVQQAAGGQKTTGEKTTKSEGEQKKVIIRDFIIKEGKVNLAMGMLSGKQISAPLPDIHLQNIGEKQGGASPAEAFKEVFAALHSKITSPAVTDTLNKGLKEIGSSLDKLGSGTMEGAKSVTEEAKSVTDKVKGIFGK